MAGLTVRWTRRALNDLQCARGYIKERNPEAARRILRQLEEALARLQDFPEMGRPGRVEGTRELVLVSTPFFLVYRIDGACIDVLAFLHARRRWPS